jgi:hypothetical protein
MGESSRANTRAEFAACGVLEMSDWLRFKPHCGATRRVLGNTSVPVTVVALAALSLYSYFRGGLNEGLQIWGEPYFLINYSSGFIKRGLIGELFSWFYRPEEAASIRRAAFTLHSFLSLLLIFAMVTWLGEIIRRKNEIVRAGLVAIFAVFCGSQFLPTLAYNTGYLDPEVFVLFLAGAVLISTRHHLLAAIVGLGAPFVHEQSIFLWATLDVLILGGAWRDRRWPSARELAVVAAPIAGTLFVFLMHSQEAAIAQMARAPLAEDVKEGMLNGQFGQGFLSVMTTMLDVWSTYSLNAVIALIFFGLPSAVMLLLYSWLRTRDWRESVILISGAAAPLLVLLFAWDRSRFIVTTQLTAMVAIIFWETSVRPATIRSFPIPPILAFAVLLAALPLVYAYFGNATVITDAGILPLGNGLIGKWMKELWIDIYTQP